MQPNQDSNLDALRHNILGIACLPNSTIRPIKDNQYTRSSICIKVYLPYKRLTDLSNHFISLPVGNYFHAQCKSNLCIYMYIDCLCRSSGIRTHTLSLALDPKSSSATNYDILRNIEVVLLDQPYPGERSRECPGIHVNAERQGFEPWRQFLDDGLANRSVNHSGTPPICQGDQLESNQHQKIHNLLSYH